MWKGLGVWSGTDFRSNTWALPVDTPLRVFEKFYGLSLLLVLSLIHI